ncbi:MAG: hypothetical protein GWM90_04725 [Gemmatimonadetes bacterium]|nr:hypothetical protein [Gemmatimonadota bacterium]NIQ53008.1 hypothetical protein [Gemmatimonadota bacterium]NIU73152.1 hypothetical protein [Gammaproteobacteria bacterium]NIX43446.1 hypothetical protein [Gemmatimonadota bacterium]NIY07622.1 hypothetical protein [Gemmatimonadota bacterium]
MIELLILGAAAGGIGAGYVKVRRFVRGRLRFVDVVQRRGAPVLAGAAGALVAAPVVWLLPVIGTGTALLFGAGVGLAVSHGAKDVREGRYALPDS